MTDNKNAFSGIGEIQPTEDGENEERFFLNWPVWAAYLLKLHSRLVRTRILGLDDLKKDEPVIFAIWHCEELTMLPYFGFTKSNILVSKSRDGAILSRAVEVFGYESSRGSSSRGGMEGLLALKRCLEAGQNIILAADGPRGPLQVAKPGPIYLAAKTGRPIYPAGCASSFHFCFSKSWSKSRLPLPGGRVVIKFGQPLYFPPEAARWPVYQQSRLMGSAISGAVRAAEKELDNW